MAGTSTAQFIFIKHGNNTDEAIDYFDSGDTSVTNFATGGPTGTNTGIVSPIAIQADLTGGFYYTIDPQFSGDGSADGQIHLGQIATPTTAPTTVYTVPDNSGAGSEFSEANAITIDTTNHVLYLAQVVYNSSLDGLDSQTGIVAFNYDPSTGALGTATPIVTRGGGGTNDPNIDEVAQLSLDSTHNVLYFTDDTFGKGTFVGADETNTVKAYNTVTHVETTVVTFPSGSDTNVEFPTGYTNGTIEGVAADPTDNLVFFSTASGFAGSESLNSIYVIGADGLGQVKLAEAPSFDDLAPFNLTFDDVHNKLYISYQSTDPTKPGHLVEYDVNIPTPGSTTGITLSNPVDIGLSLNDPSPSNVDYPLSGFLDQLPVLTLSGTATHAVEQGSAITLLAPGSTLTDADQTQLVGATVKITGGTFSSNENSATDDHLGLDPANLTGTQVNGTNIVFSYDTASETLTLTGVDSVAHYNLALSEVQYFTTGDNPTDYGNNATRTITWHVDDGAIGDPDGTNTTTTTLNIDAVNDAPVATITPATYAATEQVNLSLKNNGLSVSDADGQSETVTLSVGEGTVTLGVGTSGVIIDSGNGTNSVTFHGSIAQINDLLNTNAASTVIYNDNTDTPSASTTLTLAINDGGSSGSGGPLTGSDTATINITAVNDAPVVTAGGTLTYTENEGPTVIAAGASVTDVDSADFNTGSLTVAVSGGHAEDQLLILQDATVDVEAGGVVSVNGNVIGTINVTHDGVNGASLEIDFNSASATPGAVTTLMDHIEYTDNSDDPSTSARTVTFTVNDGDGGTATGSATSALNVTAVNDAPVATITPASYIGQPNIAIDLKNNGLSVSDADGENGSETVTLSVTSGTLTVTAGTSGAGVSGSGTNSVTITGTIAQINALLDTDGTSTVSFVDPTGGVKTLTLAIHDNGNTGGGDLSAQDTAQLVLDQPPVVDLNGATAGTGVTLAITENDAATLIAPAGLVTDGDSTDFNGGSLTVHVGAGDTQDQLAILTDATVTVAAGIVSVSGHAVGTVTGGANGSDLVIALDTADATPAAISTLIEHITYADSSDNPAASRSITFTVDDGDGSTGNAVATVNITAVNDGPAATITPASYAATEQTALNLKNNGLSVSDVDGNSGSETVTLSVGEGTLTVTPGGTAVTVLNSGTSLVTLTGSVTDINALLNTDGTSTVSYIDNTDTPSASTTLALTIHDNGNTGGGDLSSTVGVPINITAVDDAPVLTGLNDTPAFIENGASILLDANQNAAVSDPELDISANHYAGATLTIQRDGGPNADDSFLATGSLDLVDVNVNGENVSLDGGATFIGTFVNPGDGSVAFHFNAHATAADIDSVMQQIIYSNSSDNPPTVVPIDFIFNDGNALPDGQPQGTGTGVTTATVNVQVTQVDDAPTLLNVALTQTYSTGSTGVVLSPALQVFDPDAAPPSTLPGIVGATIGISGGLLAGDQLSVHLSTSGGFFIVDDGSGPVVTNISVASNAGGVLTLTGTDTTQHYQDVLDAVQFSSSAADPTAGGADTTRKIDWQVSDGALTSGTPAPGFNETLLHIETAPQLDLDASGAGTGFTTTFTENGAPLAIVDTDATVTTGLTDLESATIVLTNAKAGDSLTIAGTLPGGIDGSIDTSVPGLITVHLGNAASVADYQTALEQIRFVNTSDNPDGTDRDITVQVSGDEADSNVAHATVHVVPVNDPPVNTVPASFTGSVGQQVEFAGLSVSDPDAVSLTTQLHVDHGILNVVGVSGTVVNGNGTATVTLTGSVAQIDATLHATNNVLYQTNFNSNGGTDHLTMTSDDGGSSGTGGPMHDIDTVAINVGPLIGGAGSGPPSSSGNSPAATFAGDTFVFASSPAAPQIDPVIHIGTAGTAATVVGDSFVFAPSPASSPIDLFHLPEISQAPLANIVAAAFHEISELITDLVQGHVDPNHGFHLF